MHTPEFIGRRMYEAAGLDCRSPVDGGMAALARGLFGRNILFEQPRALVEVKVCTIAGQRRIVLCEGMHPRRANFCVAEAAAALFLYDAAWFYEQAAAKRTAFARDVGAWLVAPPESFLPYWEQLQPNLSAVARTYEITETCAAMRIQESGGPDAVVATPDRIYRRGALLRGFPDVHVRELAAKRSPRAVRKVVIRDEPGRVALLARSA